MDCNFTWGTFIQRIKIDVALSKTSVISLGKTTNYLTSNVAIKPYKGFSILTVDKSKITLP
jgi:hypothetical protein